MADRITIDIGILQGVFGDLTKLQQQLAGITGGVAAVDNAAGHAFSTMRTSVGGATRAVNALDGSVDASMRNIVGDIMAPLAKTQELEDKLRRLGGQMNTAKSVGEVRRLQREIASTQKELDGVNPSRMEQRVGGSFSRMRSMVMGLAMPIAGAFAVGGVVGFTKGVVDAVAGAENFNASMKVMLGGQEQATKMSQDLRAFAVATPFDIAGLRQYTTQLNAYGTAADGIIPTLDALGNIAAGVGADKLPQLVTAYGQVQAAGKLTGGELKQFTEAGVPLLDELAKITGRKTSEMAGNIAKLSIPFETVQKALFNMTGEGGKFYNLMGEQAKTIGGQLAAAGESWSAFLEDIGKALLPQITGAVHLFSAALEGMRSAFEWVMANGGTIMSVLQGLAFIAGVYTIQLLANNRALILNRALKLAAAVQDKALAMWTALTVGPTAAATTAQWSWNAALLANPIGIVVAAIAVLVASVVYCWNHFSGFREAVYGAWEVMKESFTQALDLGKQVFGALGDIVAGFAKMLQGAFTMDWGKVAEGFAQKAKGMTSIVDLVSDTPARAAANGMKLGVAWARGKEKGAASLQADKAEEALSEDRERKAAPGFDANTFKPGQNMGAASLLGGQATAKGDAKAEGVTVGGDAKGSGRTITMDIKITNNIAMPRDGNMGVRELAEKVTAAIVNKMNDAQFAMG